LFLNDLHHKKILGFRLKKLQKMDFFEMPLEALFSIPKKMTSQTVIDDGT
jgi:hypothetical protein